MNQEPRPPQIEPELEARIVALVLGEASDFETAALESLIEQRGELAALKQRIEAVHRLLQHVATGEADAEAIGDQNDWRLPDEQRSALLSAIDGTASGVAEVDRAGLDGVGLG